MIRKTLWILLILILVLYPVAICYAAIYSIVTGDINNNLHVDPYRNGNLNLLVRWPNGVMHSTHAELVATTEEIFWDYSLDGGLNWYSIQLTSVGHDQKSPTIALSSNWDLHFVWSGRGGGSYPNEYAIKYIHYDYSEDTVSSPVIIYESSVGDVDYGAIASQVFVNSLDDLNVVIGEWDYSPSGSDMYFIESIYDSETETWGSWGSPETIFSSGTSNCVIQLSAAVDKDDNVGACYACNSNLNFKLRDAATDTWGSTETVSASSGWPSLMASVSGGNTVWRVIFKYGSAVYFCERASGSWGSPANTGMTWETYNAIAQCHGSGDGDTGNFWAVTGDADNTRYVKYTLGSGWGTPQSNSVDSYFIGGAHTLFPYQSEYDWHWNLPASDLVFVFTDDNGNGWGDGDEIVKIWIPTDWGVFPPAVTTDWVDVVEDSALVAGTIHLTGGEDCSSIGVDYGHSKVATWSITETSGAPYGVDNYYIEVEDLELDSIYYFRFKATNSKATVYGEWIGSITLPEEDPGPWAPPDGNTTVPLPTPPADFYDPDPGDSDWEDTPIGGILDPFFRATGFPIQFLWWMLALFAMEITGLMGAGVHKNTFLVFLVGCAILGYICATGIIDWWLIFAYIAWGFGIVINERQTIIA